MIYFNTIVPNKSGIENATFFIALVRYSQEKYSQPTYLFGIM